MNNLCNQCGNPKKKNDGTRTNCSDCRRFNSQIKKGIVLPPDYSDITTNPYKNPLLPAPNGQYGYLGALVQSKTGSHIQCHLCGYFYGNLGAHITKKHKVNLRDYKLTFGLRLKEGLLSPMARERAQAGYNKHARLHTNRLKLMTVKAHEVTRKKRESGELKTGGNMWTEQTRNERGKCRLQTIAKIRELAQDNDGVVTAAMFTKRFGGDATSGSNGVIHTLFGSWEKAVEAAGLQKYNDRRLQSKENSMNKAIKQIKDFYKQHGRTPQYSDFKADPNLPKVYRIDDLFGTFNSARAAAGVPQLLNIDGKWVEVTDYAPQIKKKLTKV